MAIEALEPSCEQPPYRDGDTELPENYPGRYVKDVRVRGRSLRFRPIHPGDNDRMVMLFNTFSMKTIYHRFFAYIKMPPARVARFTNVDYVTQMAIVGEELKDGQYRLVGVARYAQSKEDPRKGEMAIVIGDPWQGQGIGTVMLQYLVDVARIEGYEELTALVHYDNEVIQRVFDKLTCVYKKRDNGTEWLFRVYPGRLKETA